jgi:hypothetical protein
MQAYIWAFLLVTSIWFSVASREYRPKIYVYDLPEKYHNFSRFGDEIRAPSCFYALDEIFPRLLRESPYLTKNAEEADYFYVSQVEMIELRNSFI